jgi:protease II
MHGSVDSACLRTLTERAIAHAQENEYTEKVLEGQLADELEAEMAARVAMTDEGVPQRMGQFWSYWYRLKGQQYRVHARLHILNPCAFSIIGVIPNYDWAVQK